MRFFKIRVYMIKKVFRQAARKTKSMLACSKAFTSIIRCLPSWAVNLKKIVRVELEVSSACNLSCSFCPVGNKKVPPGLMDLVTHNKIIDLLPKTIRLISYSYRGDVTLNPDFPKMIKYAHEKGFETFISTNGMLIDKYIDELVKSGLDKIYFTIDGATQDLQGKYRVGSDLEKIKSNIRLLVDARKHSLSKYPKEIAVQSVVSRYSEKRIPDLVKLAEDLGVDKIIFKTLAVNVGGAYIKGKDFHENLFPENVKYRRKTNLLLCPFIEACAILHNGDISVCCTDYAAKYILGNIIRENSFENIIYGKKNRGLRKSVLLRTLGICADCPITGDLWIPEISRVFPQKKSK